MATKLLSEARTPKIIFTEGAAPGTPPTGFVYVYVKADGLLYWKDDAGTERAVAVGADLTAHIADAADAHDASAISIVDAGAFYTGTDVEAALQEIAGGGGGGGDVATDTIWNAKGDLAVGTGSDTAQRLAIGANGTRPEAASGETTGIKWSLPPGYELDYAEATSNTTLSATTEATANTIVTGNSVTFDGGAVIVEFFAALFEPENTSGSNSYLVLYEDGAFIQRIARWTPDSATLERYPVLARRRITPSAGAHTYSIRGFVTTGSATCFGAAGGTGNEGPCYMRIVKV